MLLNQAAYPVSWYKIPSQEGSWNENKKLEKWYEVTAKGEGK